MKIVKLFVVFLLWISAHSQLFSQGNNELVVYLDHVAISVKDVNQSAAFYKEVLNLTEITNRTMNDGIKWMSLGNGKELHLVSVIKEEVKINKAVHLALTTSNFDALIAILEAKKIDYSDWPGNPKTISIRADGIKQIYFQDPDGYWIEVNSVGQKTD